MKPACWERLLCIAVVAGALVGCGDSVQRKDARKMAEWVDQFIAAHRTIAVFDQIDQALQRPGAQSNRFPVPQEFPRCRIELELAKQILGAHNARR